VGPRGKPERQRLLIERVEVNPSLDAARFVMPRARKKPAPARPTAPAVLP